MSKKYKVYSVRVNLRSKEGVKLSPGSVTGVVIAANREEAGEVAVEAIERELMDRPDVYVVVGKVSSVPSRFFIHAKDYKED